MEGAAGTAGGERGAATDWDQITAFRGFTALLRPRQVSVVVREQREG